MRRRVFKVLALGKSSPLKAQLREKHFQDTFNELHSNILGTGISIAKAEIDEMLIILQIWDISSHRRYSDIRQRLQRGSHSAFLVFDVNDHTSFESLPFWVESYFENNTLFCGVVLVGLRSGERIQNGISVHQAEQYADFLSSQIGLPVPYVEIDLAQSHQPKLIETMAESVLHPLAEAHDKTQQENNHNLPTKLQRLSSSSLQKLKDHHILYDQDGLRVFDSDDLSSVIELLMRDLSPEIVMRAILKARSIDTLSTMRLVLDPSYQPLLQVRIQELIELNDD